MNCIAILKECAAEMCQRCKDGDTVWREMWHDGEYHHSHGVDEHLSDNGIRVTLPPEPCPASVLHEKIHQLEVADHKKRAAFTIRTLQNADILIPEKE